MREMNCKTTTYLKTMSPKKRTAYRADTFLVGNFKLYK